MVASLNQEIWLCKGLKRNQRSEISSHVMHISTVDSPVMGATERCTGPPRLLRGGATRKGRAGGREGTREIFRVLHFKYLGVMKSGDGDPLVPVTHRIVLAWSRFGQLERVLTEKKLSNSLRLRIFSSCVVSTLLYGCEAWKLTLLTSQWGHAEYNAIQ